MSHFVLHLCCQGRVSVNRPVSSQVAFQDFLSVNCLELGLFFCPLVGVGLDPRFFISRGGPDANLRRYFCPTVVPGCEAGRIPACAGGYGGSWCVAVCGLIYEKMFRKILMCVLFLRDVQNKNIN